jgi:N-acetylmuramidase
MTQLGRGRAAAMTDAEMAALADALGCHPADLEAIAEVESAGFGWFDDGRIKILFEKHWFYRFLSGTAQTTAVSRGLARKSWVSPSTGGYADQKTADDRYQLLEAAIAIDPEAAFKSVSVGRFQIMGFNHEICGFSSAEEMFNAFVESEANQLRAFGTFLISKCLVSAVRCRDFHAIERGYNGGGLGGVYAQRISAASEKLRAGKWRGYMPGSVAPIKETVAPISPANSAPPANGFVPAATKTVPDEGGLKTFVRVFRRVLAWIAGLLGLLRRPS